MSTQDIYQPPFTITPEILNLTAEISQDAGRLLACMDSTAMLKTRQTNLARAIYGSLAIEGSLLSEANITQILEGAYGKIAPREIQKVRNIVDAQESLPRWTPHVEADLRAAHHTLMTGLSSKPAEYRLESDGALACGRPLHMAPPAARVPALMRNLLKRLQHSRFHPIIASCVFQHEFQLIHPFPDGNGRLGRLWQTLILASWNPAFLQVPVDYQILNHQEDYFQVLQYSTELADAAPFVEFMLHMLKNALRDLAGSVDPSGQKLLENPFAARVEDRVKAAPSAAAEEESPQASPKAEILPDATDKEIVQKSAEKKASAAPTPAPAKTAAPAPAPKSGADAKTTDTGRKAGRPPKAATAAAGTAATAPSAAAVKVRPKSAAAEVQKKAAAPLEAAPLTTAPVESAPERPLSFLEKVRAHAQKPSQRKAAEEELARQQAEDQARLEAAARAQAEKAAETALDKETHKTEVTSHQFQAVANALGREALEREYTSREIMDIMGLSDRKWFRMHYLNTCLEEGFLESALPRGTTSRNQRYRVTAKGQKYLPRPKKRVRAG